MNVREGLNGREGLPSCGDLLEHAEICSKLVSADAPAGAPMGLSVPAKR